MKNSKRSFWILGKETEALARRYTRQSRAYRMTALTHIYIEEHPVVPIGTFEETDKRAKDDNIRKGYENKQKPPKRVSHSVFVTNKSRTYQQGFSHSISM